MQQGTQLRDLIFIGTKLCRPLLPGAAIRRQHLLELLNRSADRRIVLISAPPGYGKTILASQWLEQRPDAVAWISLDPGDSHPDRFLLYLVEALQRARPGQLPHSEELLAARSSHPFKVHADVLLSELAELDDPPLLLALDDYYSAASPPVHELLRRMVEELSGRLRLLVNTRQDPPWPLARWRAKRWMTELRARDLRFSVEETRAFFASGKVPALPDEELEELGKKVEGWPAGLQLAQISLSLAADPLESARKFSGSDRLIADYFMVEVLAVQPAEIRRFFVVTAHLERFCLPLCDHLLGGAAQSDTADLLDQIERANLFLEPLDAERRWFRYHHLFAQLLRRHLPEAAAPEHRRETSRRAAEWFAGQGLVKEAIAHWVKAGELDLAADLLGRHLDAVINEDPSRRLLARWLAIFPPAAEQGRLPLLVAHAWVRVMRWDLPGLAALLESAEACLAEASATRAEGDAGGFGPDLDALKAFILYWLGDVKGTLRHGERATARLGTARRGMTRWFASIYLAGALAQSGRRAEAMRLLDDEEAAEAACCGPYVGAYPASQALVHLYSLDLDAVKTMALRVLKTHETLSIDAYWLAQASYQLGVVALERGALDEAEQRLRQVEEKRFLMPSRFCTDALLGLAMVAKWRSDLEAVTVWTAAARSWALAVGDPVSLQVVDSFDSRCAPRAGAAMATPPSPEADAASFWLEVPSVTYAEILLRHPDQEIRRSALPFIDEALACATNRYNERLALRLSVLRADALSEAGEREAALAVLAEALRRAEPARLARPFLDGGSHRRELLEALAGRQARPGWLHRVLPARAEVPAAAGAAHAAADLVPASLTHRERDVLELLAERLSNKEIAARLVISTETVKKHALNLYGKLGAHGRREAVARAIACGLIGPR